MSNAYETAMAALCAEIAQNPESWTADTLVERLVLDHPANDAVFKVAANAAKITPKQIQTALAKRRKAEAKEAGRARQAASLRQRFNLSEDEPINARSVTVGWLKHYGMTYGRVFTSAEGKRLEIDKLLNTLQLDVEEYGLLEKPYSLRDKSIDRAVMEHVEERREARLEEVWQQIATVQGEWKGVPRDAKALEKHLLKICKHWLRTEAGFGAAAIKKVIWQIKRKMRGLRILDHHVVLLHGEQRTGKTEFWLRLRRVLEDLSKTIEVDELVKESQLDLYTYYLIDLDELAMADRADLAKLKALITKQTVSRRVYYTQMLKDVQMSATLVGSTNNPVQTLIQDQTGMRRFIQLDVQPVKNISDKFWKAEVEGADWLGLFQMVDENGPDPMEEYADELADQQELIRSKGRVEQWMEQFEWRRDHKTTTNCKPPGFCQYQAVELYKLYRVWDEGFCSGRGMAMGNWSVQFKALIADGRAKDWSVYEMASNRTLYSYEPSNVVPLTLGDSKAAAAE